MSIPENEMTLEKLARASQEQFLKIDGDINALQSDVSVLKSDVATLKSDVSILKSDVATLKSDMADVKIEMATKEDLKDFKDTIVLAFREEIKKINYAPEIDDLRRRMQKVEQHLGFASR